jgi:twitching motility protein PilT
MAYNLEKLLKVLVEKDASDLHLTSNHFPQYRVDEKLVQAGKDVMGPADVKTMVYGILNDQQKKNFERDLELDLSFGIEGLSRFRVNVFVQRGSIGCAIRRIPYEIMSFEECGLPIEVVTDFCNRPKGLVLITGATGSGKSTTLAAMIDKINSEKPCHIITIEDPIEFVHKNKKAIVDQREVFYDTHSFAQSLKHVLRQDPDVILIGEMRDLETIESALIIAETGHLVFATLHTSDTTQTINRVIDVFPAYQQQQIRTQLSFVLMGIISQQLIPKAPPPGRVLATEVLVATPAVRSLIRESKIHQMYSVIQTGQREGMQTMNQSLHRLHTKDLITYEDAFARTTDLDDLTRLFKNR